MLVNDLQKIGLTEKEAKVYLASLELGETSVQKIANKAKVNRATTYVQLEQLVEKGVMQAVEKGSKRYFVATGPYALKNLIRKRSEEIDEKKEKLESLFPKLKTLHDKLPNRAVVRYYEGKEALQSVRELFLETKSKEIHGFYSEEEVLNVFEFQNRKEYSERRIEAKISYKGIYNPADESYHSAEKLPYTEIIPVSKDKYKFPCDISVFDDYVSISILSGLPSGILIESSSIAETFRSIFKLAYEAANESEQEKK